jgi:hypothetical protein
LRFKAVQFSKHFAKDGGEGSSEVLVPNNEATKLKSYKIIVALIKENKGL